MINQSNQIQDNQADAGRKIINQMKSSLKAKGFGRAVSDASNKHKVNTNPVDDLDLLEQSLSEVEQIAKLKEQEKVRKLVDQANQIKQNNYQTQQTNNQVINQTQQQEVLPVQSNQQQYQVSTGSKESINYGSSVVETGVGMQQVETQPTSPEISPELSEYIQRVKDDEKKYPKKIVLSDGKQSLDEKKDYKDQELIVIPITPEIEKQARFKSPKFSVRWLLEWSRKITKMFAGQVVYTDSEQAE